jgi:SAM-dependent methyltransferase
VPDLDPKEAERFIELTNQLPRPVQKMLEAIEGNCLDILKIRPELKGKMGLVLCRNVIHFLNDKEQTAFFQQLHQLLEPDGRAIVTVNSKYGYPGSRPVFDANPNSTTFCQTQCFVTDRDVSQLPQSIIFRDMTPCSGDLVSTEYDTKFIYNRDRGKKWTVDRDTFKQLSEPFEPLIQETVQTSKEDFGKNKKRLCESANDSSSSLFNRRSDKTL